MIPLSSYSLSLLAWKYLHHPPRHSFPSNPSSKPFCENSSSGIKPPQVKMDPEQHAAVVEKSPRLADAIMATKNATKRSQLVQTLDCIDRLRHLPVFSASMQRNGGPAAASTRIVTGELTHSEENPSQDARKGPSQTVQPDLQLSAEDQDEDLITNARQSLSSTDLPSIESRGNKLKVAVLYMAQNNMLKTSALAFIEAKFQKTDDVAFVLLDGPGKSLLRYLKVTNLGEPCHVTLRSGENFSPQIFMGGFSSDLGEIETSYTLVISRMQTNRVPREEIAPVLRRTAKSGMCKKIYFLSEEKKGSTREEALRKKLQVVSLTEGQWPDKFFYKPVGQ